MDEIPHKSRAFQELERYAAHTVENHPLPDSTVPLSPPPTPVAMTVVGGRPVNAALVEEVLEVCAAAWGALTRQTDSDTGSSADDAELCRDVVDTVLYAVPYEERAGYPTRLYSWIVQEERRLAQEYRDYGPGSAIQRTHQQQAGGQGPYFMAQHAASLTVFERLAHAPFSLQVAWEEHLPEAHSWLEGLGRIWGVAVRG